MIRHCLLYFLIFIHLHALSQQIEIAVQKGHSGDILVAEFNHDGKLLASAGADNLIKLWHIPTGKEMVSFMSAGRSPVKGLEFRGEDDFLIVKYSDGSIHTWDIASSSLQSTSGNNGIKNNQYEYFTGDSLYQIYIDRYYLRKKNRRTGKILFSRVPIDISKNFKAVAVSEENKMIVAACEDGKIYIYDLARGKTLGTLGDHYAAVNSVCFPPGGNIFASASSDRSIIIWDSKTLKQLKRLFGRSYRFEALAFNHSGTQLAVGDELGRGRIIDLLSSRVKVSVATWHEQQVSAIDFSANDSIIFSGGYDNRIVSFNVTRDEVVEKKIYKNYISFGDFVLKKSRTYREPYAWINTISVSPQGSKIGTGGGWRESEIRKQPQPILIKNFYGGNSSRLSAHQGAVNDILFLDEFRFLSAGPDGLVQWFYNAQLDDYYFRKKKIPGAEGIDKIFKGPDKTVLLHSGHVLMLYDLDKEEMVDSIKTSSPITSVSYNPQTKKIVYAIFNKLVFTDLEHWHKEKFVVAQAHSDKITGIDFNPTMPMVATISWDATIKLWNAVTGDLQATIISIGMDDHLIITPDNYYYGTKNSLRGIGFKYGKQFISPEQYDLRFNRPDIVLSRLGLVPKEVIRSFQRAYQKRLQRLNFTEQMLSEEIHLPEMELVNYNHPLTTTQSELSFSINATDSKYNLDRINVFVNNIPVYGLQGIGLREKGVHETELPINLTLSTGKNKIQVSCLNEKGVESLLQTFEIDYVPEKKVRPNLYVAVVSVSRYANGAMNLKYASKDGHDMISMFKRSGWFDKVIIDTLFDSRATRENILKLRNKFNQTSVDDQVIFFVSGHGLLDANLDFYFATHDVDFKNPADRGLRYDELEGLLDGIPARKKLLLMDACHSGEVDKTRIQVSQGTVLSKNARGLVEYTYPIDVQEEHYKIGITTSFELMQELFANLSKGSGAVVISAAAGNSFALESDQWHNGVFTYALLNGLKNKTADKNRNGEITVSELKDYVSNEVEKLTEGAQKPTSRRENLEFDFRIW